MKRALVLALLPVVTAYAFAKWSANQNAEAGASAKTGASRAGTRLSASEIFSRARSSVVIIVASSQETEREALGSGFIASRGTVVTNHHVVEGMTEAYVVFSDGDVEPVSRVVADSIQQDLIVLAVDTGARPPLVFGDDLSLREGDSVYALGAPKGLELTFTNGIVSSFRKSNGQFLIQTTAPIAPGSSGGPLFDRKGRVVGVTTSLLADAPGIYFSVGAGDVRRLLRTAEGVALPFHEWARQQISKPPPESSNGAGPSPSHDGGTGAPSLKDTLSWMQEFSQAHGYAMRDGKLVAKYVFYAHPTGCDVWSTYDYDGPRASLVVYAEMEFFNLSDISPDSVKVDEYGDVWFETTGSSAKFSTVETRDPSITSNMLSTHEADGHVIFNASWNGWLGFDSAESAQRFATALKHAVTLCGGTKSPF